MVLTVQTGAKGVKLSLFLNYEPHYLGYHSYLEVYCEIDR